jgi:ABC-type branched-subunit amino acid transport system ATPase component
MQKTLQENPKMLIKGLGKEYGSVTALEPSNLTVHTGEFVTLLGPSGSGENDTFADDLWSGGTYPRPAVG